MFTPNTCTGNMGAGGDAPLFLSYGTEADTVAQVSADGYFNDLANELREGDGILVNASDAVTLLRVEDTDGGIVTTVAVV